MGVSEYVFIFVSFILALAVGEVVQGVARIIRPGSDYKVDGLFCLFIFLLFGSMIEFWYGTWSFQSVESWTFGAILVPVSSVVLLYLMAELCFSLEPAKDETSVYMRLAPRLWILFAVYVASASLAYRMTGQFAWEWHPQDSVRVVMIAAMLMMAWARKRWVHWVILGSMIAINLTGTLISKPITG